MSIKQQIHKNLLFKFYIFASSVLNGSLLRFFCSKQMNLIYCIYTSKQITCFKGTNKLNLQGDLLITLIKYQSYLKIDITSDSELKMSGGDSLHLEILGSVSCQLEYLSSEVLQDGRAVHGCSGSNTTCRETAALQMTMDSEKYFELNFGTLYCFNVECRHIMYSRFFCV